MPPCAPRWLRPSPPCSTDRPCRPSPSQGNGGSGEILAPGHLFSALGAELDLEEKEGMALINGSPCSTALVSDVALAARNRLRLALEVFALSAEAFKAPLEAYSPALDALWGDEYEVAALRGLRELLRGGDPERRWYQAPVSYRILPRVLGQAFRAVAAAEKAAEISLRAVTDNPVYIPPDAEHPMGQVFSTGGYHNGQAYPAIDGVAAAWADLCLLAERHGDKISHESSPCPPSNWLSQRTPRASAASSAWYCRPTGPRPSTRRSEPFLLGASSVRTT